jgi:hypothetical protein
MIVTFAQGNQVLDYSLDDDTISNQRTLEDAFPGSAAVGVTDVDAALDIGNGRRYLFKDKRYLRTVIGAPDIEAAEDIGANWPGMSAAGFDAVDAAVNWGDGKLYFFRDTRYVRYDISADHVDPGYPKPIAGNWRGVDAGFVGAGLEAVLFPGGDRAWMFGGDKYVGISWSRKAQMPGYPVPIADAWTGLVAPGFTSGVAAWADAVTMSPSGDLSDTFIAVVKAVAAAVNCNTQDLLGVMMSESGVDPSAQNPNGKATGLIQFMPSILTGLGWTDGPDTFSRLSAEDQLPYVQKYFAPHAAKGLNSAGRLYQVTFLPATLKPGQGPDFVIAAQNGPFAAEYAANSGLDVDHDGSITVRDLDARIASVEQGSRWNSIMQRVA